MGIHTSLVIAGVYVLVIMTFNMLITFLLRGTYKTSDGSTNWPRVRKVWRVDMYVSIGCGVLIFIIQMFSTPKEKPVSIPDQKIECSQLGGEHFEVANGSEIVCVKPGALIKLEK